MPIKNLVLTIIFLGILAYDMSAICDETGSYNAIWTIQARERENSREERKKYYKTLNKEERVRISDFEIYPTDLMICGMGFSNGLGKIHVNGKAGFINTEGKIVIRPQFKNAGRFSENLAPVETKNGKWGFINKKGEMVIQPEFDWALIFREGLALIQINKKWGFINSAGKIVIEPQFDHADSFSEDLAHVQIFREKYYSGYIDKNGNWVIQPIFNGGTDFNNGEAVADLDVVDNKGNYKYTECYLINTSGKKLKELETCSRPIKSPNLLDATDIDLFFDEYKTGYKNKAGKVVWKPTK